MTDDYLAIKIKSQFLSDIID